MLKCPNFEKFIIQGLKLNFFEEIKMIFWKKNMIANREDLFLLELTFVDFLVFFSILFKKTEQTVGHLIFLNLYYFSFLLKHGSLDVKKKTKFIFIFIFILLFTVRVYKICK